MMSTQNNQTSSAQSFAPTPAGGKSKVEQGIWMYYDQATVATGKSEKTLKRYVQKGELLWRRMGKQINSRVQVWITPEFIASVGGEVEQRVDDPEIVDADSQEVDDFSPETEQEAPVQRMSESSGADSQREPADGYEKMLKLMVGEFASQLDKKKEELDKKQDVLVQLEKELEESKLQLRLLPDLQKKLEEKEIEAHLKTKALEQQVEALQANFEQQVKVVEELQSDKENRSKILEELKLEEEKRVKTLEELQEENEKLRTEAELLTAKKTWWSWFIGRS